MKRRLRIAVSAFFVLLAVLLVMLWVRSYWWQDYLDAPWSNSANVGLVSQVGQLSFSIDDLGSSPWEIRLTRIDPRFDVRLLRQKHICGRASGAHFSLVYFPHWFPILICVGFAALPWVSRRFSRRSLLTATTLIVLVLGLVVWAGR